MTKPAWWAVVVGFAVAHFLSLVGTVFYCVDNYYEQPCPLDPIGYVLASPMYLLLPLLENSALSLLLLPLNSLFWGCVLAEPVRWWCGWPPWRFSLRTLLIIITTAAVLLGILVALR